MSVRDTLHHAGLLLLRAVFAGLMVGNHGFPKLTSYAEKAASFADPLGVTPPVSMALAIVGEFFAPLFLILGLGTRIAAVPAAFTMLVAALLAHADSILGKGEMALLYAAAFVVIGLCGGGRYSLDAVIAHRRRRAAP
jgi:putative oxidoreductase